MVQSHGRGRGRGRNASMPTADSRLPTYGRTEASTLRGNLILLNRKYEYENHFIFLDNAVGSRYFGASRVVNWTKLQPLGVVGIFWEWDALVPVQWGRVETGGARPDIASLPLTITHCIGFGFKKAKQARPKPFYIVILPLLKGPGSSKQHVKATREALRFQARALMTKEEQPQRLRCCALVIYLHCTMVTAPSPVSTRAFFVFNVSSL
eukprot:1182048-Prorocentrum_minimum.AAC.2